MARLTAKVTCYEIYACGYYDKKNSLIFGGITELLDDLLTWVGKKEFHATNILCHDESEELPCYLYDINKKNDSYLVTLWHQTTLDDTNIISVPKHAKVGSVKAKLNAVEKDTIPGYPTYFLFLPKHKLLATIAFPHPSRKTPTHHNSLISYMNMFLACHSQYVVIEDDENDDTKFNIVGYTDSDDLEDLKEVKPSYKSKISRRPTEVNLILNRIDSITKVVHRIELNPANHEHRAVWQKVLSWTYVEKPEQEPEKVKFEYEISVNLTEDDVLKIVDGESFLDSYGFKFKNDPKIYWLKGVVMREDFSVTVKYDIEHVINNKSLLNQLDKVKSDIVALIS